MKNYQELKKLDEESLQKLKESSGPSDKCICNLLSPPEKKSFGTSLKNALGITKKKDVEKGKTNTGQKSLFIPLDTGGKVGFKGFQSSKQMVKRKSSCGKCGCDDNPMVLRHSFANIRITSPDLSSVCPCPTDCMPDKAKLKNNVQVIVEHAQVTQAMLHAQASLDAHSKTPESHDKGQIPVDAIPSKEK